MKKTIFLSFFLTLAAGLAQDAPVDPQPVEKDPSSSPAPPPSSGGMPTLYIVGDSTVENGAGTPAHVGWGKPLADYFDKAKIKIVNTAIGGRSSRSFQEEGRWDKVLADLKSGDFVIVQFGHNDGGSPTDPVRGDRAVLKGTGDDTVEAKNPKSGQTVTVHSYGWYMRKYAADTKAKGATAIICSLIPRKIWDTGKIARSKDGFQQWAAQAAQAEGAAFVDLYEITAEKYDALGPEKVDPLFVDPHTHTSAEGADMNAQSIISGLKALKDFPLTNYFSSKADAIEAFHPGGAPKPSDTPPAEPSTPEK